MSPEKMVHMANQIASFFNSQPGDEAEKIAAHLKDFWSPPMRAQLLDYLAAGGTGLKPAVVEAARKL
ncbi:formate dehydrogenase subunit delta [Paracoccus marinaquae]|uniref:Formate dehydrogenase subunit delta n=1 Tax=Paracoccus marinaquae TaxID=2841926 RepID=A0ABS6AKG1_9RHOB|nr:formate dehydrogenase subunit delta [Paracoccus marinaquae]MBU3030144.1 formate dehydrogenase subunit delta [Paracoccus marinaquae]